MFQPVGMPPFEVPESIADEFARRVGAAGETHRLPNVIAGVVAGGEIVLQAVAGTADRVVGEASVFRIASMTKSFTASAVLLLRDAGALQLDDPVAVHVPELSGLRLPTTDSPTVTIRHLLTMASGLATDDPWADRHLGDHPDELDALFQSGGTFAHPPGTTMEYSNYGYAILGRVVTNVSGTEVGRFVTERLLAPLGMHDTCWEPTAGADCVAGHRLLAGELVQESPALPHGGFAPMGGLWSSLRDLARWVEFFCDAFPARDGAEHAPVRRATRREQQQLHRPLGAPMLRHGSDGALRQVGLGYAMGLQRMHHLSHGAVVAHSGGLPGYGSNMRWLPDREVGVVALANLTYAPMADLTHELLEFLGDSHALPEVAPAPVSAAVRQAATALVALLDDWTDEGAQTLFADNVELDDPWWLRARSARDRRAATGRYTIDAIEPVSATEADIVVRAGDVRVRIEFQLAPTVPPRIQWYEVNGHAAHDDRE